MDVWGAICVFVLIFLIVSCCGYCCSSKSKGAVLSTPAVVTATTTAGPGGYPVTVTPAPTGGYQTNIYTPPPTLVQMPMPMPMPNTPAPSLGFQTGQPYGHQVPPYPTVSAAAAHMNPPPYHMAVGQPPASNLYAKQAPYNPNFTT